MKLPKKIRKIWDGVTTIIVVMAVLLAIALVGVRAVGLQVYTVLSGSMEPAYQTGSVIYVKEVDYKTLQVGDPITFLLSEDIIATHRIVEILPDEEEPETLRFRTKGDANEYADGGLVHYKNVIGKPVFHIPYLGYVAHYIQNPPGTYIAIAAGAILLMLTFLPDLLDDEKEKAPKSEGKAQGEGRRE